MAEINIKTQRTGILTRRSAGELNAGLYGVFDIPVTGPVTFSTLNQSLGASKTAIDSTCEVWGNMLMVPAAFNVNRPS